MIFHSYVEQIIMMCCVQKLELSLYYYLHYLPFDAFLCICVSALLLEYPLGYNQDTSQLCRTGHDDVLRSRMTTLAFRLS